LSPVTATNRYRNRPGPGVERRAGDLRLEHILRRLLCRRLGTIHIVTTCVCDGVVADDIDGHAAIERICQGRAAHNLAIRVSYSIDRQKKCGEIEIFKQSQVEIVLTMLKVRTPTPAFA